MSDSSWMTSGRHPVVRARVRPLLAAVFALVPALHAPALRAQERDPAAAEVLFREGKKLLNEGKLEQACPKLAESYALDPATGSLLATALCYERAGKLASAWAAYTEAASRAKQEGRSDREQSARSSADRLEPRLSRLIVELDPNVDASAVTVTRDGVPLRSATWGTAIPVDAGTHHIRAVISGKTPFEQDVDSKDGEQQRVVVTFGGGDGASDAPEPEETAIGLGSEGDVTADAGSERSSWTPLRTTGVVIGAFGVGGLALGGVFGLRAMSLKDESEEKGCDSQSRCTPEGTSVRLDARSAGDLATIATIAGSALVVAGATLFVIGAPEDTSVGVLVGPSSWSVRGRF